MPTALLTALVGVAVVVNLVLLLAVMVGSLRGRARRPGSGGGGSSSPEPIDIALRAAARADGSPAAGAGISGDVYDRVVRIVGYAFLLGSAVVVAASGLWPTTAPLIYALLIGAGVWIFVVHDVLPRSLPRRGVVVAEAAAAVVLFSLLIALTGSVDSPFFFGFYLIAAGAALVVGGVANFLLAAAISAVYLLVLALTTHSATLDFGQVARVGVNLLALLLLSYLASVVAREQRRTRDAAVRLSLHDPLTQLYNRNYLFALLDREIARAGRTTRRFSVLMLDLDLLKPVNDRHGHHFGDRLLREVADAIRGAIRLIDSAARYGGDEFAVVLPETDPEGALVVAEKLRRGIAAIRIPAGAEAVRTTASIGIVAFPEDGRTADALMANADLAMYESKRRGKDRVFWAGGDLSGAPPPTPVAVVASESPTPTAVRVGPGDRRLGDRREADRRGRERRIIVGEGYPSSASIPAGERIDRRASRGLPRAAPPEADVPVAAPRPDRRFQFVHHADPTFDATIDDFIRDARPAADVEPDEPEVDRRPA